jgi:hypothetical protein
MGAGERPPSRNSSGQIDCQTIEEMLASKTAESGRMVVTRFGETVGTMPRRAA